MPIRMVTVTFDFPDASGQSYATGSVEFTPPVRVLAAAEGEIIPELAVTGALVDGAGSVLLMDPSDPGLNPSGWDYRVTERLTGLPTQSYRVQITADTPDTVDLSALRPVAGSPGNAVVVGPQGIPGGVATYADNGDGTITFAASNLTVDDILTVTGAVTRYDAHGAAASETTRAQTAEALLVPLTQKGAANGVATLDGAGLMPSAQLPPLAIADTYTVASQADMLALDAQRGDVAVRTDLDPAETFILSAEPATTLGNWTQITTPGAVTAVAGKTGNVDLGPADVGADPAGSAATAQAVAVAAAAVTAADADNLTSGTVADGRLPARLSDATLSSTFARVASADPGTDPGVALTVDPATGAVDLVQVSA